MSKRYATILIRENIDAFQHNRVFAEELREAFEERNVAIDVIDYMQNAQALRRALEDKNCLFILCFNGFGSEIQIQFAPGCLKSAYEVYQKPLIDLMHDCPAHETMSHQISSTFQQRNLFLTDYGYVSVANALGMPNVRFSPSITFPRHISKTPKHADRTVNVLLPIGLSNPALASSRYVQDGLRNRVYRAVFDTTIWRCIGDFNLDPLTTLVRDCVDACLPLDFNTEDSRFLYSTIADFVKFERRRRILNAISHLPVTVVGDQPPDAGITTGSMKFETSRTFADLLKMMTNCRSVICLTPHMTGFHERVLGAMTAGATVISSPNYLLESLFIDREEIIFFRNENELARVIEQLIAEPLEFERIAQKGHERSASIFNPHRFAALTLSILRSDVGSIRESDQSASLSAASHGA